MPFGSTTNVVRFQYIAPLYSVWPTSRAVSRFAFVSASRSIEKPNLLQKDLCEPTSSWLTPTTATPRPSKAGRVRVKDCPWIVQPGVRKSRANRVRELVLPVLRQNRRQLQVYASRLHPGLS